MRRLVLAAVLLALVPCLAFGVSRERAPYPAQPSATPAADRGEEWIVYDINDWPYTWYGSWFYLANMFYPPDPNWYPFQVSKVQFTYGNIDAASVGTINRVRVFDAALNPATEWVNLWGTAGVWQTVTAGSPPTVFTGDPFYVGGWNDSAQGVEGPFQGAVDPGLWPGPYWPAPNIEPMVLIEGPTTSAAMTGWVTASPGYPTTTSAASFRVLVSGETVPVELYELKGEPRRGYVVVSWSTASESDTYGFNVYRSGAENADYEKVSAELIPGHGTTSEHHSYVFADYAVEKGRTYYYKIEDVGVDGSTTLHGPVAVPVGDDVISSWGVIKAVFK
jgi:hypothetical protein